MLSKQERCKHVITCEKCGAMKCGELGIIIMECDDFCDTCESFKEGE